MSYSNDLVDAMLLGHRTMFLVKGRNVGKTAFMKQMQGQFQKSNPAPVIATANKRSALDIVIRKEILSGCVDDVAGAEDFDNWVFEGLANGVSQTVGSIRARYIPTNTFYRCMFYIKREDIDGALPSPANSGHMDYLLKLIDAQIMEAVRDIVSRALPPHDINTCTDPECNC